MQTNWKYQTILWWSINNLNLITLAQVQDMYFRSFEHLLFIALCKPEFPRDSEKKLQVNFL